MKGSELKKILLQEGYTLADIASRIGESPQNLSSMLGAADVKSGTLERIALAIKKSLYFFYADEKYSKIAPRPDIPAVGEVVSLKKYEEKVEECALLRAELSALKEAVSVQSTREGAASSIGSREPALT